MATISTKSRDYKLRPITIRVLEIRGNGAHVLVEHKDFKESVWMTPQDKLVLHRTFSITGKK